MAGLNILSQTPSPWQLSASSTSSSISYSSRFPHFYDFNNNYNCGDSKCSTNFPLSGNPRPKRPTLSSQMQPHFSNSSGFKILVLLLFQFQFQLWVYLLMVMFIIRSGCEFLWRDSSNWQIISCACT